MNGTQKAYMKAKAALLALEAEMGRKEREFLKDKGRAESRVYAIEDEAVFNFLNEEFAVLTNNIWHRLATADEALKTAEEALLEYALSIAPAKIRETLRRGSRERAFRDQLIDLAMQIAPRTVYS